MRTTICWAATVVLLSAALAGCSQKVRIQQYPAFYREELKVIAVAPFSGRRAGSPGPAFADMFTQRLTEALEANGTYEIIPAEEVRIISGSGSAGRPLSDEDLARLVGGNSNAQAVLVGSVEGFHSSVQVYDPPRWTSSAGFGYGRGYPWRAYDYYDYDYGYYGYYDPDVRNEGGSAVWIKLLDATTGRVIHSPNQLLTATVASTGDPPKLGRYRLLEQAALEVIDLVLEQFAVVPKEIKVKPDEVLATARGEAGGSWQNADRFSSAEETMLVLVRLPDAAARNAFRLTITREDGKAAETLAESELVWQRGRSVEAVEFSPRQLAEQAGTGEYLATLYLGRQTVAEEDFHITRPR